jgi:serine/threonine protein kinase
LQPQATIEATTTFQREISLLSQLDHPNLPRVYESFQTPGHWYLVMDFIAGETLEEYQSKAPNQRLLLSEVLDIPRAAQRDALSAKVSSRARSMLSFIA